MATSNTQVTVYLPDHILEYVTEYCTEYGIVRKKDSKAILATGIVDLLNILVNIPIGELTTAKSNIPNIDVEGIIEKKLVDSTFLSTLLDTLLSDSTLRQKLIDGLLPVTPNTDTDNAYKTLPNTLPVTLDNEDKNTGRDAELLVNESTPEPLPKDESNPYAKSLVAEALVEVIVEEKEEKELTDKQKEVMDKIPSIATGEKFSYKSLADTLGVSRSVLDKFENWQPFFKIESKGKGNNYTKL